MVHPYEYMTVVEYLTPVNPESLPDFADELARTELSEALGNFWKYFPEMIDKLSDDKSWEINSHSMTYAGTTVIISILLQRRNDQTGKPTKASLKQKKTVKKG